MQFFFALVDPTDTTFSQTFARNDWTVLSFNRQQKEGQFCTLTLEIKNPGTSLLSGKVWLWFSILPAGEVNAVPLFFGRVVGIPSSIVREAVTVELVGRPADYNDLYEALTQSLHVLPYVDDALLDPQRREDPEVVWEAYSKYRHIDPVTHAVTASDILIGEDALLEFAEGEMLFDGFDFAISSDIPKRSVTVKDATFAWTQLAEGTVDLTNYMISNWPNESVSGVITSFTLRESNWPQTGASIGDNWTVSAATCTLLYPLDPKQRSGGGKTTVIWWDGVTSEIETRFSDDYLPTVPPDSISIPSIVTDINTDVDYDDNGKVVFWSHEVSWTDGLVALGYLVPTLQVSYSAERPFEELITFTMNADIQPIVTLAGEDEALLIDNIRSVNLSETLGEGTDAEVPIGDPRRRSYIAQTRGLQSLVYLLLLARAHLLRSARAVEITFELTLNEIIANVANISLRRNAQITDSRLPGGTATGKIIGHSFSVNGDTGEIECLITMGCAVGNGGAVSVSDGTGVWADNSWAGPDWQQYTDRVVSFGTDVAYEPPISNPQDDGIDFTAMLTAADVIDQALEVVNPPATQRAALTEALSTWQTSIPGTVEMTSEDRQALVDVRTEAINAALKAVETVATFKLKSMRKEFSSPYQIVVSDLKIPTQIDLAA